VEISATSNSRKTAPANSLQNCTFLTSSGGRTLSESTYCAALLGLMHARHDWPQRSRWNHGGTGRDHLLPRAFMLVPGTTLDFNSFNQTIGSLAGAGHVMLGSNTTESRGQLRYEPCATVSRLRIEARPRFQGWHLRRAATPPRSDRRPRRLKPLRPKPEML
jgi:hypothetical protein